MENQSKELADQSHESPRPALDSEMYAVAMCLEGLEPLRDQPNSLMRVIAFIGSRYVDNLKERRDKIDAEIKAVNERVARAKYEVAEDVLVDVVKADGSVGFSGPWNSIQVQAAWRAGAQVRKAQHTSEYMG